MSTFPSNALPLCLTPSSRSSRYLIPPLKRFVCKPVRSLFNYTLITLSPSPTPNRRLATKSSIVQSSTIILHTTPRVPLFITLVLFLELYLPTHFPLRFKCSFFFLFFLSTTPYSNRRSAVTWGPVVVAWVFFSSSSSLYSISCFILCISTTPTLSVLARATFDLVVFAK